MRIRSPDTSANPDADAITRVPCPGCGKGMLLPDRAKKIKEAL